MAGVPSDASGAPVHPTSAIAQHEGASAEDLEVQELVAAFGLTKARAAEVLASCGSSDRAAEYLLAEGTTPTAVAIAGSSEADDVVIVERPGAEPSSSSVLDTSGTSAVSEEQDRAYAATLERWDSGPLRPNSVSIDCPVCLDGVDQGQGVKLRACGHTLHVDCVREWAKTQALEGHHQVTCPIPECRRDVSQREVRALVGAESFGLLDRRALEMVVFADPTLHLCKTPDCCFVASWSSAEDGPPRIRCPRCDKEYVRSAWYSA